MVNDQVFYILIIVVILEQAFVHNLPGVRQCLIWKFGVDIFSPVIMVPHRHSAFQIMYKNLN